MRALPFVVLVWNDVVGDKVIDAIAQIGQLGWKFESIKRPSARLGCRAAR